MRAVVAVVVLLAGCDTVFGLGDHPGGGELCISNHGANGFGFIQMCLEQADPQLPPRASLDTGIQDGDMGDCMQVLAQTDVETTEVCIVGAHAIEISGVLEVHGERPLVLAAIDTLAVHGLVDVSSKRSSSRKGPGATYPGCDGGSGESPIAGGGSGGAGGSFGRPGGVGGATTNDGGAAGATTEPGVLRGGCDGGNGGTGGGNLGDFGVGGRSGGAVYLLAGGTLTIDGQINASGEAAVGGTASTYGGGGGGGGSGGMIALDAPRIVLADTSLLVANGGGGGGGGAGASGGDGGPGQEPDLSAPFPFGAAGGVAGTGVTPGGGGGAGGRLGESGTPGGSTTSRGGGGGGGGGTGHILLFTPSVSGTGMSSPPYAIK